MLRFKGNASFLKIACGIYPSSIAPGNGLSIKIWSWLFFMIFPKCDVRKYATITVASIRSTSIAMKLYRWWTSWKQLKKCLYSLNKSLNQSSVGLESLYACLQSISAIWKMPFSNEAFCYFTLVFVGYWHVKRLKPLLKPFKKLSDIIC